MNNWDIDVFRYDSLTSNKPFRGLFADVLGRYVNDRNDALNRIQLNSDAIGNTAQTKGLSETHVVAHELGHWLYNNLLSNRDKKEFWRPKISFSPSTLYFVCFKCFKKINKRNQA